MGSWRWSCRRRQQQWHQRDQLLQNSSRASTIANNHGVCWQVGWWWVWGWQWGWSWAEWREAGRELAEWRSQGSELAEWRSQVRELAESAAGCRTVKSGCRTVPAQAVHISTLWDLELWVSPERGCSPVEGSGLGLRLCIVCLHASQCSQWLCFSRRLLQRLSQGTVGGPGVVERWPTVHSNSAPKMGAARICGLWGHCRAPGPIWGVFGSSLGGRNRGVLQAEGRQQRASEGKQRQGGRVRAR